MLRPRAILSTLACVALCSLGCAGCVTSPTAPALQLAIPARLTKPCPRAEAGALQTNGDLGALVIREEQALNGCEAERDQAVQMLQDFNAASAALAKARR